jgi:hypothetical protein
MDAVPEAPSLLIRVRPLAEQGERMGRQLVPADHVRVREVPAPLGPREEPEPARAPLRRHRPEGGQYQRDMMNGVASLITRSLPEDEIAMTVSSNGKAWFAWRRTSGGWNFGIGAAAPPPDLWSSEGDGPPDGVPQPGTAWRRGASTRTSSLTRGQPASRDRSVDHAANLGHPMACGCPSTSLGE